MEHELRRIAVRHALTVATLVLLAVGVWLATGVFHPGRLHEPAPEWTPVSRDTRGIHAQAQ